MAPKRRLQLNGTDDAYARKDAARAKKLTGPETEDVAASERAVPTSPEVPSESAKAPAPTAQKRASRRKEKAKVEAPAEVRVNIRLHLGENLSRELEALSARFDQPMELIMKAARNRAVARFREMAVADSAPRIPEPATGGQFTRLSTVFTGEIAENLIRWFDPLRLDVAKDRIKPVLIDLFQKEARAILDGAG